MGRVTDFQPQQSPSSFERTHRAIRAAIARVRLRNGRLQHSPAIQAELEDAVAAAIERERAR